MLVGFNTNIPYKGKVYHVQTEDTGETYTVLSLLYFKGAILSSKKTSYAHMKNAPDLKDKVRELMKEQHKSLIKELINGKITGEVDIAERIPEAKKADETKKYKSLDDILIDYIVDKARDK